MAQRAGIKLAGWDEGAWQLDKTTKTREAESWQQQLTTIIWMDMLDKLSPHTLRDKQQQQQHNPHKQQQQQKLTTQQTNNNNNNNTWDHTIFARGQ